MINTNPNKDTYQIIFNSRNGTPNVAGNYTSINYYCNWASMIPLDKCTKYECSFVFKSENYVGLLAQNGFINMIIGKTQIYDGTTQSNNLGMIYPVYLNVTAGNQLSFYNSTNNDNNPIIIYPNQNIVTVNLNTFAGVLMANTMPQYVLILNLSPCN